MVDFFFKINCVVVKLKEFIYLFIFFKINNQWNFQDFFLLIFLIIIIIFNLRVESVAGYLIQSLEEYSYSFWNF